MQYSNYFPKKGFFSIGKQYWLLLLVCIVTRLLGAIFYIEDIDSLRFALAVHDYDVAALQPHFPGYCFYFMLIKPLFALLQNTGLSFATMGGIATFILIYYSCKIDALLFPKKTTQVNYPLVILLLFNPLLWLMSTRYMPDIWGLALLVSGTFYLLHAIQFKSFSSAIIHVIIIGLEAGLRLSYIPFWLPSILLSVLFFRQLGGLILAGSLSILFWLLPMIVDTGWTALIEVSQRHSVGHFTEWGGTIMANNNSHWERIMAMIESIWADGLGGYWLERHWLTFLWSLFVLWMFCWGLLAWRVKANFKAAPNTTFYALFSGLISYLLWAYFFQNIVYKPRHIMPFIPFLSLLLALGIHHWSTPFSTLKKSILIFFLTLYTLIGSILCWQHKAPSSIAQIEEYISTQSPQQTILVLSPKLLNFYFNKHKDLQKEHIHCLPLDNFDFQSSDNLEQYDIIYSTQNIDNLLKRSGIAQNFYHNPYVNRLWSHLILYQYINQHNHEQ